MKGSLYKRGNTWSYMIELPPDPLTGKRRQKGNGGFKTEEEAELAKLEKIIEIKKGLYKPDSKMTVAEYLDFWLDNYSKVKHRLTTYITNRELITKRIIPVLGDIKLINLTADHIEKFLGELSKKGYSSSYVHGIFRVLRRAIRMAHYKWELIPTDIMKKVEPPQVTKKERLTWTLEQCQTFLKAASESRFYTAYLTAINTGMRRGEVLGVQESDFSYEGKYIDVTQSLTHHKEFGFIVQAPKTKKSERRTPIIDRLILEKLK